MSVTVIFVYMYQDFNLFSDALPQTPALFTFPFDTFVYGLTF